MQIPSCVQVAYDGVRNLMRVTKEHVLESYWSPVHLPPCMHDDMGHDLDSHRWEHVVSQKNTKLIIVFLVHQASLQSKQHRQLFVQELDGSYPAEASQAPC